MSEEALKIAKRIERLRREFSMLAPLESRHNPLEIEEYQHYLLELEELIIVFRYLMKQEADAKELAQDAQQVVETPALPEEVSPSNQQGEVEDSAEDLKEVAEPVVEEITAAEEEPEEQIEEEVIAEDTEEDVVEDSIEEEEQVAVEETIPVSEMVQTGDSLNDIIKDKDDSLATQLAKQPIADLKQAFGLNERFFYANELFGGDGQEFVRAINELNHLSTFEDAKRMIQARYQESYNWNFEDENVATFLEIVERRYL